MQDSAESTQKEEEREGLWVVLFDSYLHSVSFPGGR